MMTDMFESGGDAELFEPLPTHKCKCCTKDLPLQQFYFAGTQVYGRCKRCMADMRRLNKLYLQHQAAPVSKWPAELRELITQFDAYQQAGGKIDYAGSLANEAITRYQAGQRCGDADEQTRELLTELEHAMPALSEWMAQIQERITTLEHIVSTDANPNPKANANAHNGVGDCGGGAAVRDGSTGTSSLTSKDRRRRADLLNKILADKTLTQRYSDAEIADLVQCFRDAYQSIQENGFLDSTALWRLVAMLEAKRQPLTIEMEEFYCDYLKHGIEVAKHTDNYTDMVRDVEDHVFGNYYEIDWLKIPLDLELDAESTQ